MQADLKLDSDSYQWLLTIFYIAYILFEWFALMVDNAYPLLLHIRKSSPILTLCPVEDSSSPQVGRLLRHRLGHCSHVSSGNRVVVRHDGRTLLPRRFRGRLRPWHPISAVILLSPPRSRPPNRHLPICRASSDVLRRRSGVQYYVRESADDCELEIPIPSRGATVYCYGSCFLAAST
jgi:hypothetical protein